MTAHSTDSTVPPPPLETQPPVPRSFNFARAMAWITEVYIRIEMFGFPINPLQRDNMLKYLKALIFKCHTELPSQWILLQQLPFMSDVHSIATHSNYILVPPASGEGEGDWSPAILVSFIRGGQLYYVSTWGCLTCTSTFFSTYQWSRRIQIFYGGVRAELFSRVQCPLCCGPPSHA